MVVEGLEFGGKLLDRISEEMKEHPGISRTRLSQRVCAWAGWRSANGKLREMSCRMALRELERRGKLSLPVPKRVMPRPQRRDHRPGDEEQGTFPHIHGRVEQIQGLGLVEVRADAPELCAVWNDMMERHHDLGAGPLVGAQLRYLIRGEQGWLGGLAFSAAARQVRCRDRWIGWTAEQRRRRRQWVVCNSRFLILPSVVVKNLASRTLALACQRVGEDWQKAYGYRPVLLETYVDPRHFVGTSYRAANWQHVGTTTGRGRQDRKHQARAGVKEVYLYPLCKHFRTRLCPEPEPAPIRPAALSASGDWAEQEFGGARLGNRLRSRRLVEMARDFYARPQANIPQACATRARTKGAYRFLAQKKLSMRAILAPHYERSAERAAQEKVVLAVNDTTSFNYTGHPDTEDLGPISTTADGPQGILMHETMLYTVQGLPLGLIDAQVWVRDPAKFGKKHQRKELPIEAKESSKWLRSFAAATGLQKRLPDTMVVSVGDREADVYELFAHAQSLPTNARLLVRAQWNRHTESEHGGLWDHLLQQPVLATEMLKVPRRKNRPARDAFLEVRFAAVTLHPPRRLKRLGPVHLWAVLVREPHAPAGQTPLEWMLLTNVAVTTVQEALEKVAWYTKRWQIEVFHRTLKSGCRIEQRQLASEKRLENCLAIDLVVAFRIVQLCMLGRESPDLPCTVLFEDHQWQALWVFIHRSPALPATPPSVRTLMRMIASLGGFLGRKGDGEPGTQTLWLGLQRFDDIVAAWLVFNAVHRPVSSNGKLG